MAWWNGKFTRFEIHFGYPDHNGSGKLMWIHMPKHDSKASSSLAANSAKSKSKEHNIHVRVFDATKSQCVAMFFNGDATGFTISGDPEQPAVPNSLGRPVEIPR